MLNKFSNVITFLLLAYAIIVILPSFAQNNVDTGIPLFFLKEKGTEIVFEKTIIPGNQTIEFTDPEIITFILPLSKGKAASLTRVSDRKGTIIAANRENSLTISIRSVDGKEKIFPSVSYEELKRFRIRVNIVSGKVEKQAYLVERYDIITPDTGPVIDLFGGMIPMQPGDYSITLETSVLEQSIFINGSVQFTKAENWMVVEATLPDGKKGKFILDTGASGGLVIKHSALPDHTEITELKAEAHSFEGISVSEGKMEGATGNVSDENFMGVANLSTFQLGDMLFQNVEMSVMKTFPDFLDKLDIIGIIGQDILKMGKKIQIEHPNENSGMIRFISEDRNKQESYDHSISLFPAAGLLFTKGEIQGVPVNFLLDTGAGRSIMSSGFAEKNNIKFTINGTTGTSGISGKEVKANEINLPQISIGPNEFNDCHFLLSPGLEITKSMGLESSGVILGMSFLNRFSLIEIDFIKSELHLKD